LPDVGVRRRSWPRLIARAGTGVAFRFAPAGEGVANQGRQDAAAAEAAERNANDSTRQEACRVFVGAAVPFVSDISFARARVPVAPGLGTVSVATVGQQALASITAHSRAHATGGRDSGHQENKNTEVSRGTEGDSPAMYQDDGRWCQLYI
jgi:hypothetical protein